MAKNSTNPIKVGTGKSHPPKDMKRKKVSHSLYSCFMDKSRIFCNKKRKQIIMGITSR